MDNPGNLVGKVVIVTGGAQGIGEAAARRLVADGARVVIADIADDTGRALAATLGETAAYTSLDVTDAKAWGACVAFTQETFGPPHALVSNAGVMITGAIEEATVENFRRAFDVNALGSFLGIRAVLEPMRRNGGGSIVVLSSLSGLVGNEGMAAYCASKGASTLLARCAALEFGGDNIRVNSVHPGRIETAMSQSSSSQLPSVGSYDGPPLGRIGQADEVAALIAFLVSDDSSYITGTQQVIDGGRLAGQRYPRPK